jgi:hypothetical protein
MSKLVQKLNPLSRDSKIPNDESCDITTGMPMAFRQSKSDGIDQLGKYYGDRGRQLANGEGCR